MPRGHGPKSARPANGRSARLSNLPRGPPRLAGPSACPGGGRVQGDCIPPTRAEPPARKSTGARPKRGIFRHLRAPAEAGPAAYRRGGYVRRLGNGACLRPRLSRPADRFIVPTSRDFVSVTRGPWLVRSSMLSAAGCVALCECGSRR